MIWFKSFLLHAWMEVCWLCLPCIHILMKQQLHVVPALLCLPVQLLPHSAQSSSRLLLATKTIHTCGS